MYLCVYGTVYKIYCWETMGNPVKRSHFSPGDRWWSIKLQGNRWRGGDNLGMCFVEVIP